MGKHGMTCVKCYESKRGCDGGSPCGRCQRLGISCVLRVKQKRQLKKQKTETVGAPLQEGPVAVAGRLADLVMRDVRLVVTQPLDFAACFGLPLGGEHFMVVQYSSNLHSAEIFARESCIVAANLPSGFGNIVNLPIGEVMPTPTSEGCRTMLQQPRGFVATVQTVYGACDPTLGGKKIHCKTVYMFFDQEGTAKFAFIHVSTDPNMKRLAPVGPVLDFTEMMKKMMITEKSSNVPGGQELSLSSSGSSSSIMTMEADPLSSTSYESTSSTSSKEMDDDFSSNFMRQSNDLINFGMDDFFADPPMEIFIN